jgi:hypothetical protein
MFIKQGESLPMLAIPHVLHLAIARRLSMKEKKGNQGSELRYVLCRVEPGMFRGEFLVHLDGRNPNCPEEEIHAQLFADERDIKGLRSFPERNQPVPGWLAVSLVRAAHGLAQVVLPQPAQPFGETLLIAEAKVQRDPQRSLD